MIVLKWLKNPIESKKNNKKQMLEDETKKQKLK